MVLDTEQNPDEHENWSGEDDVKEAGRQGSAFDTGHLEAGNMFHGAECKICKRTFLATPELRT